MADYRIACRDEIKASGTCTSEYVHRQTYSSSKGSQGHIHNPFNRKSAFRAITEVILQPLFGNDGLWVALLLFQSARSIAFRLMLPKLAAATFR
ncbi:hypothetical protein EV130_111226 [Rhizobium azibense]|uniref:Uncharacterized protein n=1 Tax=Rhizobium azibense TaxID=1136135 RepID=A0A4R3QJS5_9HYPH|nr:hypothetical protein EV130_111226 [Rhizobium azibense]